MRKYTTIYMIMWRVFIDASPSEEIRKQLTCDEAVGELMGLLLRNVRAYPYNTTPSTNYIITG